MAGDESIGADENDRRQLDDLKTSDMTRNEILYADLGALDPRSAGLTSSLRSSAPARARRPDRHEFATMNHNGYADTCFYYVRFAPTAAGRPRAHATSRAAELVSPRCRQRRRTWYPSDRRDREQDVV